MLILSRPASPVLKKTSALARLSLRRPLVGWLVRRPAAPGFLQPRTQLRPRLPVLPHLLRLHAEQRPRARRVPADVLTQAWPLDNPSPSGGLVSSLEIP